jgi:hypothetical protein
MAFFSHIIIQEADDAVALFGHAGDFAEDGGGGIACADDQEAGDPPRRDGPPFFIDQPDGDAEAADQDQAEKAVEDEYEFGQSVGRRDSAGGGDGEDTVVAGDGQADRDDCSGEEADGVSEASIAPGCDSPPSPLEAQGDPDAHLEDGSRPGESEFLGGELPWGPGFDPAAYGEGQPKGGGEERDLEGDFEEGTERRPAA